MKRFSIIALIALGGALAALHITNKVAMSSSRVPTIDPATVPQEHRKTAVFAGGCFWCMEPPFEKLYGVLSAESGYTGGFKKNPPYEEVCRKETGHVEAVRITYDDRKLTYDDLLQVYWRSIDPTDGGGQFADRGSTYAAAIFVGDSRERDAAEKSKKQLAKSGRFKKPIVTTIRPQATFYPAEDYHQDYYKKNYAHYKSYRYGSGRESFLQKTWGDALVYHPPKRNQMNTEHNAQRTHASRE